MILYRFADFMPIGISVNRYAMLPVLMQRVWIPALRRLMAEKGWNQATLAEQSGVRPNTISDVLNGSDPRVATIDALAMALGVPIWALFCTDREYALFASQRDKADADASEKARQDNVRAAIQAELAPLVDSIVAKLSGQPVVPPTVQAPVPAPALAPKARHKKRA